ncbi:MAG: hypothetical protein L6R37_002218 [Teloschistes peruensis]|nr:MAG: hypothetical protein L6R37_002218 [Teloschistes peruensis]
MSQLPDCRLEGDDSTSPETYGGGASASLQHSSLSLNLEHCLWKNHLSFLIHPKVKIRNVNQGELRIAEIGTRTGLWLTDLAKTLGPSVQLDGFGSDLSLAPPPGWLPTNVSLFQRCNFVSDIEENLNGFYDVVRVDNIASHVFNNDPGALMKKFVAMLKPNGYLQWNESDTAHRRQIKSQLPYPSHAVCLPSPQTDAFLDHIQQHQVPRGWINSLPDIFMRYGLKVPLASQQHRFPIPNAYATAVGECQWAAMEESLGSNVELLDVEGSVRSLVQGAKEECKELGMCVVCDMVVVVGKKVG